MTTDIEAPNPIFQKDGQWFFWDETWSESHGPYTSKAAAETALSEYAKAL